MYHTGNRELQDHFGSRALADRLLERTHHVTLTEDDKAFIESRPFFFLATATPGGAPDCSFKGGAPGFVSVPEPDLLVFPDYDGNGMFKSLGNIRDNPQVGLLFNDLSDRPRRLRVNGHASVVLDDPLLDRFAGAQALVRVRPQHVFPNCPRYIHRRPLTETSPYCPRPDVDTPTPAWKSSDWACDVLPQKR
jgi:predicted pyridoxine 5'-phosphate oxidase superfamily flavin-nucleotide-binding protein